MTLIGRRNLNRLSDVTPARLILHVALADETTVALAVFGERHEALCGFLHRSLGGFGARCRLALQ